MVSDDDMDAARLEEPPVAVATTQDALIIVDGRLTNGRLPAAAKPSSLADDHAAETTSTQTRDTVSDEGTASAAATIQLRALRSITNNWVFGSRPKRKVSRIA